MARTNKSKQQRENLPAENPVSVDVEGEPQRPSDAKPFRPYVVAIGASAGGLDALSTCRLTTKA